EPGDDDGQDKDDDGDDGDDDAVKDDGGEDADEEADGDRGSGLGEGEDGIGFDENGEECNRVEDGGYAGKVYQLSPGIKRLPNFATLTPVGEVEAPRLDVPPRAWTSGFPGVDGLIEWFAIVFEAELKVPSQGRYQFKTHSD